MLNSSHNPNINPALYSMAAEFFAHNDQLDCIQAGQRYSYEMTPDALKAAVARHLTTDEVAKKALKEWAKKESIDELKQYTFCLLGGYTAEADIDANGNVHVNEYHNCPNRGTCDYAGKVCKNLKAANGTLTKTEQEVLKTITKSDQQTADRMFVSVETINSHMQNLGRKTGYMNKAEKVLFASKVGIIQ